eukprot:363662-Chlamydomonas_euryale.AAC.14
MHVSCCCCFAPVVLPLDALVAKDVAVVAPRRVGDVHGLALHEARDERRRDAQRASARQRVQAHDAVLCVWGGEGGEIGGGCGYGWTTDSNSCGQRTARPSVAWQRLLPSTGLFSFPARSEKAHRSHSWRQPGSKQVSRHGAWADTRALCHPRKSAGPETCEVHACSRTRKHALTRVSGHAHTRTCSNVRV